MAKKAKKSSKKRRNKVVEKAAKKAANKEATGSENKGSGLKIHELRDQEGHKSAKVKPGERLYLNAAKDTLYPEGHQKAASLYCTEHRFVPRKEFESLKKGK